MLELKNIKKVYPAGDGFVHALKGIDLQFRENEFVSILGPSGCGKTTMLNIIGGLDQYSEGDLIINGTSTKDYKDRDWDTYRNHSIGFVFQSYNLIPHQSVLQNVELALTLSGVSKAERRERAKKALEEVGLGSQLNKKPGQMSGGQMQRVAIARALVNNPDIILADEPTGALDTETSVQVMEILKNISKDRLIIMVTHNPELAKRYSTRIIRILDGEITDDSNPISEEEQRLLKEQMFERNKELKKKKKPSMSLKTSFGLSMKNLFTKKGRTILTSFAGSIGIIGIALIFAVSNGLTSYIDSVQEETLSSYPLMIESTTVDLTTLMETFMGIVDEDTGHENDAVYQKPVVYNIINAMSNLETTENDLRSFKQFIEKERKDKDSKLSKALNGVQYTYNLDMLVYTKNVDGEIVKSDTEELMKDLIKEYMGADMSTMIEMRESYGMGTNSSMSRFSIGGTAAVLWQEMLPGEDGKPISPLLEKQYDLVYGSWPNSYDEIVLVLDENNELDDLALYALGLESRETIDAVMEAALNQTSIEASNEKWSYEEICSMEYRTILNSSCYSYDEAEGVYTDLRETDAGLRYLYDQGIPLKVTGIIKPNEDSQSAMLVGSIGYTSKLTEYIIEHSKKSDAVNAQMESKDKDIFNGLPFRDETGNLTAEEKEKEFRSCMEKLDAKDKADAYIAIMGIPSEEELNAMVQQSMGQMTREDIEAVMLDALTTQMGMDQEQVQEYVANMADEELQNVFEQMLQEQIKSQTAQQVQQQMGSMSTEELAAALDMALPGYSTEQCEQYYDEVLEFSESSYEENMEELGYIDMDDPATINLYASSFDNKEKLEEVIASYNKKQDEIKQIKYTDYVGIMMSAVSSIINTITYVLVAFVAISLIVSSIMIGVITLISVQERTKEIGILRAIGASKRDVSSLFNAETVIIGLAAGLLGVLVTHLLCIPINIVIHALTDINSLNAYLPIPVAVILVMISMILTLISGIIPSKSAAKKDPVVALRTE